MNLQKFTPKIFAGIGVVGVVSTAVLAVRSTPKAMQLIEASGARTAKEKFKAAWKCYIPAGASGVITIAAIIANHSVLMRQNAELALAYGFGQTALRLYSERTPVETRNQISAEMMKSQEPPKEIVRLDTGFGPEDQINECFDYLSSRYFHASRNQINKAIDEFNETILKVEGQGSLNQLYLCFHNQDELPPMGFANLLGWKYVNGQGAVPMVTSEFDKNGNPCIVLDFFNPPQYDYNNTFA